MISLRSNRDVLQSDEKGKMQIVEHRRYEFLINPEYITKIVADNHTKGCRIKLLNEDTLIHVDYDIDEVGRLIDIDNLQRRKTIK